MTVQGNNLLEEIERTPVDRSDIHKWDREYPFLKLAADLMRETGQWVCVLSNACVGERDDWSLEEAVLGGHLVRLFKLIRHAMDQTKNDRGEMLWISLRLMGECAVNFRYLLENRRPEVFESFLHHSLQHEKALLEEIDTNVAARGGEVLPIEERMRRSINKTLLDSNVSLSDLPEEKIRNWGNRNFRERIRDIGLENAYSGIFGGPSRNVHGNWQDFLQHHLEVVEPGRFRPKFDDARVRPQALFALSTIIIPGLIHYVRSLGVAESDTMALRLQELNDRVVLADALHEEYLSRE